MRYILLCLLLIPTLTFCQKIGAKFDNIDSVFKIGTKAEKLAGNILGPNYFSFYVQRLIFKAKEFESIDHDNVSVYFQFKATRVISLDEDSKIKIQFSDNLVKEYPYFGNYKIYSTGDVATFYFEIADDDYLLTHPVSIIRIPGASKDYEISEKNADFIKKTLSLVADYKE